MWRDATFVALRAHPPLGLRRISGWVVPWIASHTTLLIHASYGLNFSIPCLSPAEKHCTCTWVFSFIRISFLCLLVFCVPGTGHVFIVTELACGGDLLALLLSEREVRYLQSINSFDKQ